MSLPYDVQLKRVDSFIAEAKLKVGEIYNSPNSSDEAVVRNAKWFLENYSKFTYYIRLVSASKRKQSMSKDSARSTGTTNYADNTGNPRHKSTASIAGSPAWDEMSPLYSNPPQEEDIQPILDHEIAQITSVQVRARKFQPVDYLSSVVHTVDDALATLGLYPTVGKKYKDILYYSYIVESGCCVHGSNAYARTMTGFNSEPTYFKHKAAAITLFCEVFYLMVCAGDLGVG